MTANYYEDKDPPPAKLKDQLSKKLLLKERFLSKITFKSASSDSNQNPDSSIVRVETSELIMVQPDDQFQVVQYQVYPQRWWVLATVVILNLANYSHWVAFPSIAKNAAKHYDQSGERMDLIPTVSYGLGVPCCLLATYVVERFGLRVGLHIGGVLTGIGGLMCCLSTLPSLSDGMTSEAKFWLALIGQAMTGVACPFISCVPTKISQHWFNDEQRTLATILLGMSNPMGIVMGQLFTPLLVQDEHHVPIMNIIWFIPAGLGSILTIWKVTSNVPLTPPSPSAALAMQQKRSRGKDYLPTIRDLLTNWPFMVMFLFVGGAMGYVSAISTKIEQILCSRGYTDQTAGLAGSLILFMGFVASFPMGILSYKTKKPILICKLSGFVVITSLIMLGYFMRLPNQQGPIIASCVLLGIFALGSYPLALELIVECTYPLDQAIGTAFIFLSSSLQGVILMMIENHVGTPLSDEDMKIQTCVDAGDVGHQQPKDYSNYLNFITVYMLLLSALFMICFKTEMKRSNADEDSKERAKIMANNKHVEETETFVQPSSSSSNQL